MKGHGVSACLVLLCACGSSVGSGGGGQKAAKSDASPPDAGAGVLDATTSDAGGGNDSGDSGEAGEAGESGPPSLCPGTFLFCDGFEQNLTNWSEVQSSGGQVYVDSVHVYRGAKALHANLYAVAEAGTQAWAYASKYGTQPWPTHVFTRLFAYVPSPSPSSPYAGLELRVLPSNAALAMETFDTNADKSWQSADASAPLDQWVCFEVEADTNAETSHLYMNDVEVTDLAQSGLALMQLGITNVGLTLPSGNVEPARDAWIDEVAVDSARIGCAR
jgi:hypothetical protein